jgi:hypothetical protein
MKLRSHFLSLLAISSTFVLTNCFGGGPSYSYQNVTISVAPQPASVPVNSTQTFTATVTNAPPLAVWIVQGSQVPSVSVGTITTATTDAPTSTYTAPAVPPIYTDDEVAAGSAQGTITILAEANSVRGSFTFVTATTTFVITGPISVGLSPMTASLNVGGTQQSPGMRSAPSTMHSPGRSTASPAAELQPEPSPPPDCTPRLQHYR